MDCAGLGLAGIQWVCVDAIRELHGVRGLCGKFAGLGWIVCRDPQSRYAYAFSFASVYAVNTMNQNGFRRLLLADVVVYNYCYYGSLSVRFNGHFPFVDQ